MYYLWFTVPSSPRNLNLNVTSPTNIWVSWEEPSELNGVITSYTLKWKTNDSEADIDVPGALTVELNNLTSCLEYTVTVAGNTKVGPGNESDPATEETDVECG